MRSLRQQPSAHRGTALRRRARREEFPAPHGRDASLARGMGVPAGLFWC